MDLSSSTLKNRAKRNLTGLYGQSIVVSLIYTCIVSFCSGGSISSTVHTTSRAFESMGDAAAEMISPFNFNFSFSPFSSVGSLAMFLLTGPLTVGLAYYFLHVADRKDPQIADMFAHLKYFGNTFVLYLLTSIFTFLWTLLFIIPGIIAAISYSMAPYILAEHPEIKASDAIKMSKEMMRGHKGEYFVLQLSFIGWILLCLLTAGIGFIFLSPYMSTANAEFFNEVSGKNTEKRFNGIDVDGTATDGGNAQPAFNGYAQPEANGYNGYAQPDNSTDTGDPQPDGNSEPPADPYGGNG